MTTINATISGNLTLTGGMIETLRLVTASGDVTVNASDVAIVLNNTTPATTTVTLPTAPASGRYLLIKDGAGNASSFPITISGGTIDGSTTKAINTNFSSVELIFNGSTWSII
jgi:hypothetical protein